MTIHHSDHDPYRRFTERQRVDRAVHTLTGLLHGIAIDDELNAPEIAEVINWCNEYRQLAKMAPFNELIPKLDGMMKDRLIDPEELEDLLWLCRNLAPESGYYDEITNEIQTLQGMLHGIMADGHVSMAEATRLQEWLDDHAHLKGTHPYDELDSVLLSVLADRKIDPEEQEMLRRFFEDFIQYSFAKRVARESGRVRAGVTREKTLPAVCAACPEIAFQSKTFTFTGTSAKAKRSDIAKQVEQLGGIFSPSLTRSTDFLVVGAGGNPCWAFSCYGRKVEKAAGLRKEGQPITIVHESDFWDAVQDNP